MSYAIIPMHILLMRLDLMSSNISREFSLDHGGGLADAALKKFLFFLMAVTVTLNGVEWSSYGVNLTPERILVGPFWLLILFVLLISPRLSIKKSSLLLLAWFAVGLTSSVFSPADAWSVKMAAVQAAAISYYFITLISAPNLLGVFKSRVFILLAFFCGPVFALLYTSVYFFELPDYFLFLTQEGSGGTRLRGTITEANLFGVFVIFFILVFIAINKKRRFWWWLILLGLNASLVFSFSRAPWGSFLVSLLFYYYLISPRKIGRKDLVKYLSLFIIFSILVFLFAYLIFSAFGEHEIIGRIHSIRTRLIMWELAVESFLERPIIGSGFYSFSAIFDYAPALVGSDTYRSAWISNLPLAIIHDTGVIGFLLFFGFVAVTVVRGWRAVRWVAVHNGDFRFMTRTGAALLCFIIVLMVSSLSIPAHSLAFFWVGIALLDLFSVSVERLKASGFR